MKYIEVSFTVSPASETANDIIAALAMEQGFESFVESPNGTTGYVPAHLYDEEALQGILADFPMEDTTITFTAEEMEDKNWNEEWEKHFFQPIVIGNECVIHSTFHTDVPKATYDIIIDPKMSFGTGHHATTANMLSWILEDDMTGKRVLDMGCGTAVLGILAKKKGADSVLAIDIDSWCYENAQESAQLNHTDIEIQLGDASLLAGKSFDIVLANINRNILLNDMAAYVATLAEGGVLYMSGFYTEDIPVIAQCANDLGLTQVGVKEQNNWVAVKFVK